MYPTLLSLPPHAHVRRHQVGPKVDPFSYTPPRAGMYFYLFRGLSYGVVLWIAGRCGRLRCLCVELCVRSSPCPPTPPLSVSFPLPPFRPLPLSHSYCFLSPPSLLPLTLSLLFLSNVVEAQHGLA
eukprot:6204166-Pleurochrysis_carterae.AAC.3